jgi:hypothetical protein
MIPRSFPTLDAAIANTRNPQHSGLTARLAANTKNSETVGSLIQAIFNEWSSISPRDLQSGFKQVFQLQSTILDAEKLDIKAS